nr:GNAT family N-acetyltransferase [uncultured Acetatifactor sp.]
MDGHSGYGIRPSERRKGYAAKMLSMALPIMKGYGINPVIITCAKDNIGSAKTIQRNGGIYIKDAADGDGEIVEIYHIPV